jgi:4-hydroxybenzoate polyprenyltransferase
MVKLDKLKEEIGWIKIIFGVLIATDISLVAWLVQNYGKASLFLLIICVIMILLITFAIIWINRVVYRKIDELEGL